MTREEKLENVKQEIEKSIYHYMAEPDVGFGFRPVEMGEKITEILERFYGKGSVELHSDDKTNTIYADIKPKVDYIEVDFEVCKE